MFSSKENGILHSGNIIVNFLSRKKLNKKNPLSSLSVIVMLHLLTEHRGLSSCSETSDD